MSGSKKRFNYTMAMFIVLSIVVGIMMVLFTGSDEVVPFFGLQQRYHILMTNIVFPVFGSVICALFFPRLLAPLYLSLKKIIMSDFKNGELDIDTKPYGLRKWLSRAIFVSLLVLGIQALLIGFFPHTMMITPTDLVGYEGANIDVRFVLSVTTGIVGLVTPFAVGLLSVGWSLEDAGLVHYDLPKESDRIYEIEPIFRRFVSYIKGYAGFSSILFLVSIVFYFLARPDRLVDAIFTIVMPFQAIMYSAFGYFIYVKTNTKFLKGRYPAVGRVTEDEIAS